MRSRRWGSPFSLLTAAIAFLSFSAVVTANPGLKNIGQEGCNNGSCYVCEGDCDTDADCAGFLKCFQRDDLDAVPGCSVAGDGFGAWDYCYEDSPSNVLPGLKNIGQEGCNNGSCNACEGDCDTDADCAGSLKCFERDNQDGIPGCSDVGDGYAAWDYCYNASPGPTPTASGIELFNNSLDGCGSRGCEKCEGDCDSNADCAGSLTCFFRNGLENVPGCSGGGYEGWDYCIRTSSTTEIKNLGQDACSYGTCNECEGDCDYDSDCSGNLMCFRKDNMENVPGCVGYVYGAWDYCYDPNSPPAPAPAPTPRPRPPTKQPTIDRDSSLWSYGECNNGSCGECQGDCDSDSGCAGDLKCFKRKENEYVPGCGSGGRYGEDYCIRETDSNYKQLENKGQDKCRKRNRCERCEGDCDTDRDCKESLYCFKRDNLEPVPGCGGTGKAGWDYCASR